MNERTKALQIPKTVKLEVALRDNGTCVHCGSMGFSDCHYIKRSQGGLGVVPWNITTLCRECEHKFDDGAHDVEWAAIKTSIISNFKWHYLNWEDLPLIYEKGKTKGEDYGYRP